MFWKKKKQEDEIDAEPQEYAEEEIDQIMDDAEILDTHQEGENKTRSKNTKVALIGVIAMVLLGGIYFGSKNYQTLLLQKDKLMTMVGLKKEALKTPEIPAPSKEREQKQPERPATEELDKKSVETRPEASGRMPRPTENVAQEVPPSESPEPKDEKKPSGPEKIESHAEKPETDKAMATPPPAMPITSSAGKYAIQVGTFSIKENAVKLIQKLTERGHEAYGVPVSGFGNQRKVYAGPFYSKLEAEEAAEDLRKNDMASARVAYDQREAAYRVEIGRYASDATSERIREKIRRLGYQEGSDRSPGGGSMTAVYIGNFSDRATAEEIRRKLPREEVPSSMIVVAPRRS